MAHYGFTAGSQFDFRGVESRVRQFWDQNKIYEKAKAQTNPRNKFYFVDGPPYTSGSLATLHFPAFLFQINTIDGSQIV